MNEKYFGKFSDRRDVANNFLDSGYHDEDWEVPAYFPTEDEILFASYGGCSYAGSVTVPDDEGGTHTTLSLRVSVSWNPDLARGANGPQRTRTISNEPGVRRSCDFGARCLLSSIA